MGEGAQVLRHGSLFSGIGGFDLAAERAGWKNIFHCEFNPFCNRILRYHFAQATSYEDITKTDFSIHKNKIDILTGGFPCQPYSLAGKRLGKNDERHLWPCTLRAVREIRPRWVVAENVLGIVSWNDGLVFEEVQIDLEAEGYQVQPFVLPAAGVDAPHRRERIWFIAYRSGIRRNEKRRKAEGAEKGAAFPTDLCTESKRPGEERVAADTYGSGLQKTGTQQQAAGFDQYKELDKPVTHSDSSGVQRRQASGYAAGRGSVTVEHARRYYQPSDWQHFPTQSPVCHGNDGLPFGLDGITFPKWRSESIKAGGNAIVPKVALQIFKTIQILDNKYQNDIL